MFLSLVIVLLLSDGSYLFYTEPVRSIRNCNQVAAEIIHKHRAAIRDIKVLKCESSI